MSDLMDTTIGDVCEVYDGPHATPKKIDAGPIFLSISSLVDGRLDLTQSAHISEEDFVKWTKRVTPRKDDLVFSYETRLGDAALVPEGLKCCLGRRLALMRVKDTNILDPRFLLYYYLSAPFQNFLKKRTVYGSTVNRIPLKEVPDFPLSLPKLSDQKAIAHVLGTLDDKIELNQKMNQTLEEIAKALFKSWFVDFDPVRAKAEGRPTGLPSEISDLFPDELVDSEIGEIPKGWESAALESIFTPRNERAGEREIKEYSSTNDGIQPRDAKYKKNLSSSSSKNKVAYKGDFIFGMSREVLNFGLMFEEIGAFSSAYKVYEVTGDFSFSNYIYRQFLAHAQYYYQAVSASSREGQSISQDTLLGLRFLLPNVSILNVFNSLVSPMNERCQLLLDENNLLNQLRDTLLPKLISGELRIPDAEKFLEEAGI